MTGSKHLGSASIIIVESVALRDGIQSARLLNGFSNPEIEGDFEVIIDGFKQKK